MEINALEIFRSLPDFQEEITGIVPNFGGKCFDITLRSTEGATRLATSGFDYGAERKPLKLLGAKTIHVSVFVAVEFPDQEIVKFLQQYGQLKSENLRRLCYNEEGFRNIERGIRVAEFTSLDRDLPRKVVTQGLEIFFKYTGQPITCYRCGSTEHARNNVHALVTYARRIAFWPTLLTPPPLRSLKWKQTLMKPPRTLRRLKTPRTVLRLHRATPQLRLLRRTFRFPRPRETFSTLSLNSRENAPPHPPEKLTSQSRNSAPSVTREKPPLLSRVFFAD